MILLTSLSTINGALKFAGTILERTKVRVVRNISGRITFKLELYITGCRSVHMRPQMTRVLCQIVCEGKQNFNIFAV